MGQTTKLRLGYRQVSSGDRSQFLPLSLCLSPGCSPHSPISLFFLHPLLLFVFYRPFSVRFSRPSTLLYFFQLTATVIKQSMCVHILVVKRHFTKWQLCPCNQFCSLRMTRLPFPKSCNAFKLCTSYPKVILTPFIKNFVKYPMSH